MEEEILIGARFPHRFFPTLALAELQASREAADTGGAVLRAKSLTVDRDRIVVSGVVPWDAVVFGSASECAGYLEARSIGNLNLTRESLTRPSNGKDIGYLVLQTPVLAMNWLPDCEDEDFYWAAAVIGRVPKGSPRLSIGAICCARCNRPISPKRLVARPTAQFCTNCREKKEGR